MQPIAREPGSLRIVVADDNRDTAISSSVLLQSFGFQVVGVAYDGATALALIQDHRPHVALLDIAFPDIDGYQIAERVRRWPAAQPKLIAVTGLSRACDRMDIAAAGFDAFFAKPVDWVGLQKLLLSYLPTVTQ